MKCFVIKRAEKLNLNLQKVVSPVLFGRHTLLLPIEKRVASIVLRNPGTLLISIPQYYEGGHSECRNPSLQKMFGLIGRSDKAGSGVDKILKGWKFAKWRRPYVIEKSHPDMVELFLPLESLFSDFTIDSLKKIYGESVSDLPHNELTILALALSEEDISNSSLQGILDLHPSDLTKTLKKMCKNNMLIAYGLGRGTVYRLNKDYIADSNLARFNPINEEVMNNQLASSLKENIIAQDDNAKAMIRICCRQWKSAKEISLKIGRHPTYIREILKKMLNDGELIQEYPNQPTHPAQRYRLKSL